MKYSNSIEYNISTKLDKTGISQLQTQIKQVELSMQQMANRKLISESKVQDARQQLQGLSTALTKAFNPSLGMLDLSKFRAELRESHVSAEGLQTAFSLTGAQGAQAFGTLARQIGNFNNGIERTSSTIDKLAVTFGNTFRWGLISSFFSQFMNAIHSSVEYAKELDDSLTQIMLVTDYSRDSMNEYAKSANEAAKAVGQTTVGMTNASLIFAQQGYDLNRSQELATLSARLANASQQDTAATSDQITAYMNAYGLQDNMEELAQAMDNWALIANISAADVEEIALASQRAASMANAVGVSGEALAAQIATIESVTREAPEQIGNGLKTLYARFSDLQLGKEDEDGVGLGKVTSTLEAIGVQVLDSLGNVRSMDDIMEDLMAIWQDLDDTTQEAVAQTLAGKHQVNRFTALMDNADMYQEYLGATGANAAGTLEQMNQEYLDSLQGRMATLQATLEGLFNDVFTTDMVYPLIDILTKLASAIDTLFKSVGGGPAIILGLASAFTRLFSNSIARGINDMISNKEVANIRKSNLANIKGALEDTGLNNTGVGNFIQAGADRAGAMNAEQYRAYTEQLDNYIVAAQNAAAANEKLEDTYRLVGAAAGVAFKDTDLIFKEDGTINTTNLVEELNGVLQNKEALQRLSNVDYSEAIKGAEEYSAALGKLNTSIYTMQKEGSQSPFASWNLDQSISALAAVDDAMQKLHESGALTNDEFAEGQQLIDRAQDELINLGHVEENTAKELDNLNGGMARFAQALRRINPEVLKQGPEAIEAAIRQEIAAIKEEERALKDSEGFVSNLDRQNMIKGIVDTASAFGQVAFAIQSVINLPSIWKSNDLNNGEKLLQTITNLSFVLPSLIKSFQQLTGIQSFSQVKDFFNLGTLKKERDESAKVQATAETELTNKKTQLNAALEAQKRAQEAVNRQQERYNTISDNGQKKDRASAASKGNLTKRQKTLAQTTKEVARAEKELKTAEEEVTNATNRHKEAAERVEKAEAQKNKVLRAGAFIATTVIMTAIAMYTQAMEALVENSVESFNDIYEKANVDTTRFDELYNEYKRTGVASDELKEESTRLSQVLGIVGGAALTASGNFDQMAESIHNTKDEMAEMTATEANRALGDINNAANNIAENFMTVQHAGFTWSDWTAADSAIEKWALVNNALQENIELTDQLDAEIAELKAKPNLTIDEQNRLTSLEFQRASLAETRGVLTELLSDEGPLGNVDDIVSAMAESALEGLSEAEFKGMSYDEIVAELMDPTNSDHQWIRDQYRLLAEEDAQAYLDGIVQGINPAALAEHQEAMAISGLEEIQNIIAQNPTETVRSGSLVVGDFHRGEQGLADLEQLAEELNLSSRDTLSLANMIDWTDPNVDQNVAKFIANIRADVEAGLTAEQIVLKYTIKPDWENIDQQLDYTQEEAEKILKDAGLEGVSVDEYVDSFLAMGGAGAEVADEVVTLTEEMNYLTEAIAKQEDILAHYDPGTEEYKNAERVLAGLNSQLTEARDRLTSLALASRQTANGVKQLSSQWKGISENLNSGNVADQVAGLENLRPILADIFNVDANAITQDFMLDVNVQDNIQALAEGDMSALDRLRTQYGEINVWAYLRDEGFTGDIDTLKNLVDYANNEHIEVGATLDISDYKDALVQLVRTTSNAEALLRNMFEGIGYDVQVDYVKAYLPNAQTDTVTTNSLTTKDFNDAKSGNKVVAGKATMKIQSQVFNSHLVEIPKITFTKKGGATPSSGGSSGGGSGGGCFVAGTLVSTQDSFKEIENIQIGDIVLSYNEEIHQNEYSIVLQTMIHDVTEEIYDLYIEDEILTVTGIHRFYVRRKHNIDWIPASDLRIGDYVLFVDGNWHPIFKIKIKVRSLLVYNFEVSHNHNYYVGRNQILAHNKGGGGGGGGGTSDTMEKKELVNHEKDYYEEVDSQLDQIGETLSGIEKQEDRLIGEKARQNQAKQIALLEREIQLQQDKLGILQNQKDGELTDVWKQISNPSSTIINNLTQALSTATETEKTALKNLTKDIKIPAPDFDDDGIIKNFEDISEALDTTENNLINKYNGLIDSYNKSNSDSTKEQIEALDKIISKYEEEAGKVRENVQRYNDLQTEAQKLKNTMADLQDQIEDLRIEAYKGSLDALDKLKEINETAAGFAGFFTGLDSDNPLRKITETLYELDHTFKITKADASAFLRSMQSDMVTQASKNYFENLSKNLSDSDLENGMLGFLKNELDRLRNWGLGNDKENNPFGENTQAWKETYEEVYKKLGEKVSDFESKEKDILDNLIDYYDEIDEKQQNYIDQFEHLADKMEWLKDIYSIRYGDESYQALSDIGTKQAEILKSQLTQQIHIYELWTKRYEEAVATGNEEATKAAREIMDEAEEKMRDIAKESAETFVDAYNDAVDAAIQKMYQATIGENNLDRLDRNWEWDKKNIDRYRDEVERTFEVEQLRNKYNDLLNGAQNSSLAIQNKIREQMQEQLDLLENQKTMSEYDVKLANSKLLILQKEIALEEAQRNKNQMQLRRDTQGNYRYVYRANQNDVAKARQEYIQAVQDAYELTKEQTLNTAKELGNALKDYAKQYADLNKNMNLSDAERALQSQELRDKFLKYMQNLQEDLMDTGYGLSDVLNSMIENGTEDIAETAQIMLDKAFDMDGNLKIGSIGIEWLDALTDYLGITYNEIEKATGDLTDQTKQDADKLSQQINDVFSTVPDKIAEYNETIEKAEKQTDALTESTQNYLDTLEELPNKAKEALATITDYTTELKEIAKLLEDIDNTYWDLIRLNTDELPFNLPLNEYDKANNKWAPPMYTTGKFNPDSNWGRTPSEFIGGYSGETRGHAWQAQYLDSSGIWRWVISGKPVEMASGGYTGNWGKNGKLAVLHEKELVLNAQDTENVYAAVKAAKQFAASLEADFLTHLIKSKPTFNAGRDSIEQRVEIKAEFPSVRDAFEIETALTNLADKAYQYAHRKI